MTRIDPLRMKRRERREAEMKQFFKERLKEKNNLDLTDEQSGELKTMIDAALESLRKEEGFEAMPTAWKSLSTRLREIIYSIRGDEETDEWNSSLAAFFEGRADRALSLAENAMEYASQLSKLDAFAHSPYGDLNARAFLLLTSAKRQMERIERGISFRCSLNYSGPVTPTMIQDYQQAFTDADHQLCAGLEKLANDIDAAEEIAAREQQSGTMRLSHAAAKLKISRGRVTHLADDGTLEDNKKKGKDRRVTEKSVNAYLRSRQQSAIKKNCNSTSSSGGKIRSSGEYWKCKKPGCDWVGAWSDSERCPEGHSQGIEIINHPNRRASA